MAAVKLFRNRRGERKFRRLDEGNGIRLEETFDDKIIIGFNGMFTGDVVIDGNLTVNGTETTINSTTHVIADNKIIVNDGEVGAGVVTLGTTAGIQVDRGSEPLVEWCWDETGDLWTTFGELLGGIAAPTLGTHVGDRAFNDARYLLESNNLSDLVNATTARQNLGAEIGVDVQAWDADLDTLAGLSTADSNFIVGSGASWVVETGGTVRTSLGLSIGIDVVAFSHVGSGGTQHATVIAAGNSGFMTGTDKTKLNGIETSATADQTANEILIALLTVDGSGSLLDADFLDGLDSTAFLQNVIEDTTPQLGGNLDVNAFGISFGGPQLVLAFASGGEGAVNNLEIVHANTGFGPIVRSVGADTNVDLNLTTKGTGSVNITGAVTVTSTVDGRDLAIDGIKLDGIEASATTDQTAIDIRALGFFDITNDGTGSGLDADLLDGLDSTAFTLIAHVGSGGAEHADVVAAGASGFMTGGDKTKLDGVATGATLNTVLTGSSILDFPSIAALGQADLTMTVTGATVGDEVALGLPAAPTAGIVFNTFVSAANTVTVRAHNYTAGAVDPASATYNVRVFQ